MSRKKRYTGFVDFSAGCRNRWLEKANRKTESFAPRSSQKLFFLRQFSFHNRLKNVASMCLPLVRTVHFFLFSYRRCERKKARGSAAGESNWNCLVFSYPLSRIYSSRLVTNLSGIPVAVSRLLMRLNELRISAVIDLCFILFALFNLLFIFFTLRVDCPRACHSVSPRFGDTV